VSLACKRDRATSAAIQLFARPSRGAIYLLMPGGTVLTLVIMFAVYAFPIIAGLKATRKRARDFTGAVGPPRARP
jgi:hypothetical protein